MQNKVRPVWIPKKNNIETSNMLQFIQVINNKYGTKFITYSELYNWSIENLESFWKELWDFAGIISEEDYSCVLENPNSMLGAKWFPGAKLNFAKNLLRYRNNQRAITFYSETQKTRHLSYKELYHKVRQLSKSFQKIDLKAGDRLAAFMPNMPETVIAMLAATSRAAVWSSCSPDFGIQGVLDRFKQIEPAILITTDSYTFKGKKISLIPKIEKIAEALPGLKKIIIVPFLDEDKNKIDLSSIDKSILYEDFLEDAAEDEEIDFVSVDFSHPVYIMYSSGTTGLPKCMVQGSGVLLNHLKELLLHTDLKKGERIFYFTTCGWMMWNWLVSSLAVGATLILFDGNPFYPEADALWKMAEKEKINVFGVSAGYLSALEKTETKIINNFNLKNLRTILSTGSPLSKENFSYVYKKIKEDVCLSSISGGTDLNGCFALGNPMLNVNEGELQCRGLGMAVEIFDDEGRSVVGEQGELVCSKPFPSMPLYFWNDVNKQKYKSAYFDVYPGIWRHGDFAEITVNDGLIIHGRSDATLNPGGVRMGTAELYRILEKRIEIEDSVVVGQKYKDDQRIVLFIKLKKDFAFNDELVTSIKMNIRKELSPRHVPAIILKVQDIPYTINGKKVELAVKRSIEGLSLSNADALRNPECLSDYKNRKELI